MSNNDFIEMMSQKGYKHYQGHLTENFDKISSTGRNQGRYIKLKFMLKFSERHVQGYQLSSNEVTNSIESLKSRMHLLKQITGTISNKKFMFKSKGHGQD